MKTRLDLTAPYVVRVWRSHCNAIGIGVLLLCSIGGVARGGSNECIGVVEWLKDTASGKSKKIETATEPSRHHSTAGDSKKLGEDERVCSGDTLLTCEDVVAQIGLSAGGSAGAITIKNLSKCASATFFYDLGMLTMTLKVGMFVIDWTRGKLAFIIGEHEGAINGTKVLIIVNEDEAIVYVLDARGHPVTFPDSPTIALGEGWAVRLRDGEAPVKFRPRPSDFEHLHEEAEAISKAPKPKWYVNPAVLAPIATAIVVVTTVVEDVTNGCEYEQLGPMETNP